MWLELKFDLFFTILIISDIIRTVISLSGENICLEQERYVAAVRKPFKKPVHVREYKWCLQIPPRCEEDKIVYVDDYKTEEEERIRIIEKCCTGFKENLQTETCVPISCAHCVHATCNETVGKCLCEDGYIGENCDTRCSYGKWGPDCALSCDCNNSLCQHTNGTCICSPGWLGQRCDKPCPNGFYGENCYQKCSKCLLSCNPITGACNNVERISVEKVADTLKSSSTIIPTKRNESSSSITLFSKNYSGTQLENVRYTSEVYPILSTNKPFKTQFQNERQNHPSISQVYAPKYIKIIPSYSSNRMNKSHEQELDFNRTNSSIVYIKKPASSIKQSFSSKTTEGTFQQMTTINVINIDETNEPHIPSSNYENSLETTTEPLPIVYEILSSNSNQNFENKYNITGIENLNKNMLLSSDRNESTIIQEELTIETTTVNILKNNSNKSENEFDKTLLEIMQPLYGTTESPTNSSPQLPQSLPDIIVQNVDNLNNINSLEIVQTTEAWPEIILRNQNYQIISDIYQTTEKIETTTQTQSEITLKNQNNLPLSDILQITETPVQIQSQATIEKQSNSNTKETYQTTEMQPEVTIEYQRNPDMLESTTEIQPQMTIDNQNSPVSTFLTTEIISEILVDKMTNLSYFETTKTLLDESLPETTVVFGIAELSNNELKESSQTTEILTKTTIENVGYSNYPDSRSADTAETEMISTFTEPSITVTASNTTYEGYVSETPVITNHQNQLEVEMTSAKQFEKFDENLILSHTNIYGNSLNTVQPYFEIKTNRSTFSFTDGTNISDQLVSDVPELLDHKRTYLDYNEDKTGPPETSVIALTTITHVDLLPITNSTETSLLQRDYEPKDIFINANKSTLGSNQEPKTTPRYRTTFMKPEVQIPINTNESGTANPTYHSIISSYNPNEIKIENDSPKLTNKNFSNDGSIHNMEMTLNNSSIKLFITNPNLTKQRFSSPYEEKDTPIWTTNNFDTTEKLPNSSEEQPKYLWTANNFDITKKPVIPNKFEEEIKAATLESPDNFFTTDSIQFDTIERKHNQESSPIIQTTTNPNEQTTTPQTTTNPTITETTIIIPLMNDTLLNISQTNSTISDIIKMLTSKTYFNQYQISTKIPLNSTSTNPMQDFTVKLTPNTLESSTIKIEPILHPINLTSHNNQTQASHDNITSLSEKLNLSIFTYPSINNTYNYYIYQGNNPNLNQTFDGLLNPFKELLLNSQSTTPIVQTNKIPPRNKSFDVFTHSITFNFSEISSTVQTPYSVLSTDNSSYETSTTLNKNIKANSEIFINKNISIKIFSTPAPENYEHNKNITNEWPNRKYNINQKDLDDSDIIPLLSNIFTNTSTQKIDTTTKPYSFEDTTIVYSNQTDVFDYETNEDITTNKSIQTTEYSIKDNKPMIYNNLSDVIMKIYNDDDVIKDLERNNDLLRRVHDAIVKDAINNNQTLLINQSNTQTIYHTVMITLLGIAIGIFLAIIIASIILYMTDTSRKVAKHTRARLQSTAMNKKDYTPNSVHYIQRDEFMTPLQERITIFNPKFSAEPESTFGNLLTTDCRDKVNRFITDTLRVVYDNTYDHPQSPPTNGQFVGSTFFATKSDQSAAEHLYDEIPAWKQLKPVAQPQLPQYSETCEYVTKSDGPDIVTTKL